MDKSPVLVCYLRIVAVLQHSVREFIEFMLSLGQTLGSVLNKRKKKWGCVGKARWLSAQVLLPPSLIT